MTAWREAVILVLALLVYYRYRHRWFLYPLRLFSTLLHELGHALAAILSGGRVLSITVSPTTAGLTRTYGGSRVLIYNAGYVGNVLFGALLFLLPYSAAAQYSFLVVGLLVVVGVVVWIRNPFTLFFCLAAAVSFCVIDWLVFLDVKILLAKFFGSSCILHSWFHIGRHLEAHRRSLDPSSDAGLLQLETGIPAVVWCRMWQGFAAAMILLLFSFSVRQ